MEKKRESLIAELKNQNDGETMDFEIPEDLEKKNVAYASILLDLQTCHEALLQLKKRNNEIVKTSLFTTVIILYGKCFTNTSFSKLEFNIFESDSKLQELHLELMNLRHNFVAHRGHSQHEFGKAFFQINPRKMVWGIKVGISKRFNFEPAEIPEYLYLIEFLSVKVYEKYDKVQKKLTIYIFENLMKGQMGKKLKMIPNENVAYKKEMDSLPKGKRFN